MREKEGSIDNKRNETHLSHLASVGQIAAGIAHEVKNPLTAVKGFLQLLKERNEIKYIEIAESELGNAIDILQNLLHVSKPDLEDEPYVSIDLTVELESLTQLFQDQMYRVAVHKDLRDPGSYIFGKRNQLKKVFFNLLKNAFEAIPEKGSIHIEHLSTENEVIVRIRDTGVGIPQEKLNMLGTPFFTTKENGTGMGLTLVFSVIYQHNGSIDVQSAENAGTQFTIAFPKGTRSMKLKEVVYLELEAATDLKDFFIANRNHFEQRLLLEAVNVRDKIDEILAIGNIDLLDNAHKLVLFIIEGKEYEVIAFAKQEGVTWAKHSLTLAFKLEWIQAVRRVLWDFLYNYDRMSDRNDDKEHYYSLEKSINQLIDLFLNQFFISYSQFKDDLIRAQREMVADLSVPIIPLTRTTSILPLIGTIDGFRANAIEDKIIAQIGHDRIETLIVDLSGVIEMAPDVVKQLINVFDGIQMMGCRPIVTGLRPEIVKMMIRSGLSFEQKAETKGTLQQALVDHLTAH
ncbi:ATP-binding protein [Cohnella thailandensis]|uniref:histidine kinase n=1 Tax=Cohnella thailandensis TaxID=557557 RepID=A0A841SXA2_9BACL|nr:ATP-binding protein [Cohnella thailandensis]MBB6634247.1 STAS domain-containing protein [Cohnella thailandensis]MBP1972255.1 rsbT co-antagonist protein RsbR [Cohnella thailandensis]